MIRERILFRLFFSLLLLLSFSPFCTYEPTSQIHPNVTDIPYLKEVFRHRTNERIAAASEGVQELAQKYGAQFLNLNEGLADADGNLKAEFTIEGMHMYADGYRVVLRNLLPVLKQISKSQRIL